jgi:hypothetical protein
MKAINKGVSMLSRLILAVVVAVVVTLACILLGAILHALTVSIALTIGDFLKTYSAVIGILAGLWYFFQGYNVWPHKV